MISNNYDATQRTEIRSNIKISVWIYIRTIKINWHTMAYRFLKWILSFLQDTSCCLEDVAETHIYSPMSLASQTDEPVMPILVESHPLPSGSHSIAIGMIAIEIHDNHQNDAMYTIPEDL